MPHDRLDSRLAGEVASLREAGIGKGAEAVVIGVESAQGGHGPRIRLAGANGGFLRMNSNSYLGLSRHPSVIAAEEAATQEFGTGPGAVRFISGTYQAHLDLEARLARFHGREASMVFSSAYATVLSVLTSLITEETVVLSDELNHNCIINALRLARPASREVFPHLDLAALDSRLEQAAGAGKRAILVTDGVFSMRGDFSDLAALVDIARAHDADFEENVVVVVDDSHGVGAFGETGRGTEEVSGSGPVDVLIGTLGKAFGVNGGYVSGAGNLIDYLRETAPMYIYSNPITVGEAAAATAAISVADSAEGKGLLDHLAKMTTRFESGLVDLGFETIPGPHPVVPLMVRDTERTTALVRHLFDNGVLATGLNYPVVPKGSEELRFQVNADHTEADIDFVLGVLAAFEGTADDRASS
ncbi:MAG: aminotransferase class I/II-fold pyridoxal phosphate-dependent enzyme [Acidimicrobiia bacterium]